MGDWKIAGIAILASALIATIIGAAFLTIIDLQNQTVAYQQSYGYNTPYQSVPYPTPAVPGNGSVQTPPTQPPYAQQPTYPAYPYYPPDYGYGYPYGGYGFGEHGSGPWRGMG